MIILSSFLTYTIIQKNNYTNTLENEIFETAQYIQDKEWLLSKYDIETIHACETHTIDLLELKARKDEVCNNAEFLPPHLLDPRKHYKIENSDGEIHVTLNK